MITTKKSPILRTRRTLLSCLIGSGLSCDLALAQITDTSTAAPATLSAVVVTASGFEQAVEDAPASITVIPREELEQKAYKDVVDALRDVPGVIITGSGSNSDISIRGMSASYTMLLVDGRRQNSRETRPNSDGPGMEQGWLPPLGAIERIEVIRGPMSSLYGSDALGGVVNIITRKVPQAWSSSLRADGTLQAHSESGNIGQGQIWLAGPIQQDRLGLQVYSQRTRRSEDEYIGGLTAQEVTSNTAKLSLTPMRDHDIVLEANRTMQKRHSHVGKTIGAGPRATDNINDYDKTLFALSHTGRWGIGTSTTYLQREEIDNPVRQMNIKNTEFSSMLSMALGASHLSTVGVSYKNEDLRDMGNQLKGVQPRTEIERYQWALYAENEWSVTSDLALTTGLRMNRDENYGTHWTPRIYGVWHATDYWTLKGGVSSGFRAPGLRAAVADWGSVSGGRNAITPYVTIGNPNLKPEKSLSHEVGIVWDNRDNLNTSLTVYNTDFKDRLGSVRVCEDSSSDSNRFPNGDCVIDGVVYRGISNRINIDKANIRGVEATFTWQALDSLRLAANYTHTRSEQKTGTNKGQPLNRLPKHMFNASADWKASNVISVWSRLNMRGRTTETVSTGGTVSVTPTFTFIDMGLNYRMNKDVRIGVGVYNLFDKQVNRNNGYDVVYDGRRYWLSLTAGF